MNQIYNVRGHPMTLDQVTNQVNPGWQALVKKLVDDLFLLGWDGHLHQIKEKFGGLRFYIGGASTEIHNRIDQAEAESMATCDQCGLPGKQNTDRGWIATRCEGHS